MSLPQTLPPVRSAESDDTPAADAAPGVSAPRFSFLSLALAFVGLALFVGLFLGQVTELAHIWNVDDNYSHGFLVPFLSAYLAWDVARRQSGPGRGSVAGGLLWVGIGTLFHCWALVVGWPTVDFVALTTILYGTAVLVGGRLWAGGFAFPLLFLVFMFPLPPAVTDALAVWLQGVVGNAAAGVLGLFVPVYHSGNVLEVSGQRLEVGEACSGLRQLIAFVALALLVAHRGGRSGAFKTAIVLAALPVAVAANLMRVLLMTVLSVQLGSAWISEKETLALGISYHTAWGLLTMVAGLGLFLAVRWWLSRAFPLPADQAKESAPAAEPLRVTVGRALGAIGRPELAGPWGMWVAALAVALVLQAGLGAHLEAAVATGAVGLERPLSEFPETFGPWAGRDVTPNGATLSYYQSADDGLNRNYVPREPGRDGLPRGLECQLFMVYFKDGRDRRHHPIICNEVAGAKHDAAGDDLVDMGGPGHARRFCFTRGGFRSYVYYWHYTLEPVGGEQLSPLQSIHQDLGVRRPSLTVEVFTNAQAPEHLEKVAEFVRDMDRKLQAHLPQGASRGSDVLPVKYVR